MRGAKRASIRRRRAREAHTTQATALQTAPKRPRRRYLSDRTRRRVSTSMWDFRLRPGSMGVVMDIPLYSCRYLPKEDLALPLEGENGFSCLLRAAAHISDDAFRDLGRQLLGAGMRYAVCNGVECDRLSDLLNELLEEGEYHLEGRTAAACCDDGSFEEALEYFILPSGMAPANLVLTLGDQAAFQATLESTGDVVEKMRESLAG